MEFQTNICKLHQKEYLLMCSNHYCIEKLECFLCADCLQTHSFLNHYEFIPYPESLNKSYNIIEKRMAQNMNANKIDQVDILFNKLQISLNDQLKKLEQKLKIIFNHSFDANVAVGILEVGKNLDQNIERILETGMQDKEELKSYPKNYEYFIMQMQNLNKSHLFSREELNISEICDKFNKDIAEIFEAIEVYICKFIPVSNFIFLFSYNLRKNLKSI